MKHLFNSISNLTNTSSSFESLDVKRFLVDSMDLVKKVAHHLQGISEKPGSKKFRHQFDTKIRNDNTFKETSWMRQVMAKLKSFLQQLSIRQGVKSEYFVFEKLCNFFTLKVIPDTNAQLRIPNDLIFAVNKSLFVSNTIAKQQKQEELKQQNDSDSDESVAA